MKSAKEYLNEIEPFLVKELENHKLRGKICEVMENYALLVTENFQADQSESEVKAEAGVMPNEVLAGGIKRLKQDLRGIINDMNKWLNTKDEYRAKSETYILETKQTCEILFDELESQREA